ncbi:MerR family transcriptional regulator, partial [Paraburkholderia phymatum]|uniref:MerR family transcriptional regulator n=1 Tax=Paraburkholderia phymatum TaxID=148447 RepID=UPI003181DFFC
MPETGLPQTARVGIGALLRQLQPRFPDLTASKVRFLEDQGLVHPHRTASGYRKYSVCSRRGIFRCGSSGNAWTAGRTPPPVPNGSVLGCRWTPRS